MRRRPAAIAVAGLLLALACCAPAGAVELGVKEGRFTLDGREAFLLGISYYGALGASDEAVAADLDDVRRAGFNWFRVWATWAAFGNEVSAVDATTGEERPEPMKRLRRLVEEADKRGLVVNVTLSRGNGATGPPRLQTHEAHRRAVEAIVTRLKGLPNWYLDLSNERNLRDQRFTSVEELAALLKAAKAIDPKRLVTASEAGDAPREAIEAYVKAVGVDFVSVHLPRNERAPARTAGKTRELLASIRGAGRVVPLHYDEPFRRGFQRWQPTAEDFAADLAAARANGAAGWCFHNGHQADGPDGRPRRSFDLRDKRLFEQLDDEERRFIAGLGRPDAAK